MLALTNTQWNWILMGTAILLLALIVVGSVLWDRRDRREAEEKETSVVLGRPKHEDSEAGKAA